MVVSEKAQIIAISVYAEDLGIIDAADTNDAGRSATLRRIIREWEDWRRRMMIDTPGEYVTAQIGGE